MRLYLEQYKNDGDPAHINYHIAKEGFRHFGFHIMETAAASAIPADDRDCVAVGSIQFIKAALNHLEGISRKISITRQNCGSTWAGRYGLLRSTRSATTRTTGMYL